MNQKKDLKLWMDEQGSDGLELWIHGIDKENPCLLDALDKLDPIIDAIGLVSTIWEKNEEMSDSTRSGVTFLIWSIRDGIVNVYNALDNLNKRELTAT